MSKQKQWFEINAKGEDAKTADIYLYEDIGEFWGEGMGAKRFADELNALGKLDAINLFINSSGGSVFDGVAIYNTLKRHPATVNVKIDGIAASIASVIAMAGDTITMAENGWMMIHDPWVMAMGNARELRDQADVLDKVGKGLVDTYAGRTGLDAGEIASLMAAETWFLGAEAVEKGFADATSAPVKMAAKFDLTRFRNAPKDLDAGPAAAKPKPTPADLRMQIADMEHWLHASRKAHGHPLAK